MRSLGLAATDAEAEDMINEIDLDRSGSIDIEGAEANTLSLFFGFYDHMSLTMVIEFIKMMTVEMKPTNIEAELKSAFAVFDRDGSGTISGDEIAKVMKSFGENLTDEELGIMLREVDKNGDGHIDCRFL